MLLQSVVENNTYSITFGTAIIDFCFNSTRILLFINILIAMAYTYSILHQNNAGTLQCLCKLAM